jgi:mRNA interferase MazF
MKLKRPSIAKGEIHLIPFPFTDNTRSKLRPCIVIGHDRDDVVVVFVTSIKPKDSEYLKVGTTKENKLKVTSYIRYTKIATLDTALSLGQIGTLNASTYKELTNAIKDFIS